MRRETPCFTLIENEQNLNWDAGVYIPAQIGSQVWIDNNRNNTFDNGDTPLNNAIIQLFRCDEPTPIATQTTTANGQYLFVNVAPGSYKLQFTPPTNTNYQLVTPNVGSDFDDSDVENSGFTACYILPSRRLELNVDAGFTTCPPVTSLACLANVNLTMNATCSLTVTPEMLLASLPPCTANLEVRIGLPNGASFGNMVTSRYVGQTLRAVVIDKLTNNFCTSNIIVRDVLPPTMICPTNTNKRVYSQQMQLLSGTLTRLLNAANLSSFNCFRPVVNVSRDSHYYEIQTFEVDTPDMFTFELSSKFGDGAALLYDGEPNFNSLCEGVLLKAT